MKKDLFKMKMGIGRHEEDLIELFDYLYDNDYLNGICEVAKEFEVVIRGKNVTDKKRR